MTGPVETFSAPAKINLCLHVIGRRQDGYHEVAMLLQQIDLHDRVTLRLRDGGGVRVTCPGLVLPAGGENIVARAAKELFKTVGIETGLDIGLEKKIPVAAGLGGGSSDAATVLTGLNRMLNLGLEARELMDIGVKLGADVPFFIFGKTAWATGIGERLEKVPELPPHRYVLVNPGIPVSTAWVYQNLGLTSPGHEARLPRFSNTIEGVVSLLWNDLEKVTIPRYPVIKDIKDLLLSSGASGALMSGSGPTVFGVFEDAEAAREAERKISAKTSWLTFLAAPL